MPGPADNGIIPELLHGTKTAVLPAQGRLARWARFSAIVLLSTTPWLATAGDADPQEHLQIARLDGSLMDIHLQRPATQEKVPLLIYVDGSLCIPSTEDGTAQWLMHRDSAKKPYATVIVDKSGTTIPQKSANGDIEIGPDFACSREFKQHYTIDQRVSDHLRALQYLRRHAEWWNGELLVWGFSDGGRIGAQLASYYPQTQAVALVGFGGGTPMATSMEDMVCATSADTTECLQSLRKQMDEIRAQPVPGRDWMGEANTYAAWASRLDAVEANILRDLAAPLLVVHGERDGSVPVVSARKLAERMQNSGVEFRYREVTGMRHSLGGGREPREVEALHQEVLAWLLDQRSSD
ncbi:alpha/beta hydrolase [Stenotrophomonas sp.]|uniref:alpha/beta hydrolase family protein n=1 Tax=Stenotrophomonas sp. TaxID=69392 RepID=UPI0028ACCAAF|nr:alpha/beta hydrolase [Stenotrophomonas sp.]